MKGNIDSTDNIPKATKRMKGFTSDTPPFQGRDQSGLYPLRFKKKWWELA
jgi:hypothetical protein